MAEPVRVAAVVPWEKLVDFAQRAYEAAGCPPDQARDAAEAIVDADGHGRRGLLLGGCPGRYGPGKCEQQQALQYRLQLHFDCIHLTFNLVNFLFESTLWRLIILRIYWSD